MNIWSKGKELVFSEKVQEFSLNLWSDCVALLAGDKTAAARIFYSVIKGAFSVKDQVFWNKFECFLNDLDASDDFLGEFCRILTEDWEKPENQHRLIDTIDKIDTMSKAVFLANASRCLCAGMIDRTLYFRFCHILKGSLYEDLLFLQENVLYEQDFIYSDTVQGLLNVGLMYQKSADSYSFTPLAKDFDKYAVSYNNVERYPMILEGKVVAEPRQLSIESGIPIVEF